MRLYSIRGEVTRKSGAVEEHVLGFVRQEIQAKRAIDNVKEYGDPDRINMSSLHYELEDIEKGKEGLITWLHTGVIEIGNSLELIEEIMEDD